MPIYQLTENRIDPVEPATFAKLQIYERGDLKRILRHRVDVISKDLMVIAEEFGDRDASNRRIDLLCIDKEANLVVVELKRSEDGEDMDLQAIRYSAMVSKMTFDQAVQAHQSYLESAGIEEDAQQRIFNFLDWKHSKKEAFGNEVKIILVSDKFPKELTDSVLWLNNRDVRVRCVIVNPYRFDDHVLLEVQQVIPLPEADERRGNVKQNYIEDRMVRVSRKQDRSKFTLSIDGRNRRGLNKRYLMYHLAKAVVRKGGTPEKLSEIVDWMGNRLFYVVDEVVDEKKFVERLTANDTPGKRSKLVRFFYQQEQLFVLSGKTYALSNQWGPRTEQAATLICEYYRHFGISFEKE